MEMAAQVLCEIEQLCPKEKQHPCSSGYKETYILSVDNSELTVFQMNQ